MKLKVNDIKLNMKVEVLTRDGWKEVEYGSWLEIVKEGWKFLYQSYSGTIVMSKNGYINEFRNKKGD